MKCKEYFWSRKSQCHKEKNNKGHIFCPVDQRTINGNRKAKCLEVDVRALKNVDPTDAEGEP